MEQECSAKNAKRKIGYSLSLLLGISFAYLYGVYSYPRNLWPLEMLRDFKNNFTNELIKLNLQGEFDNYGRLISYPGKTDVNCPSQTNRTGVLLAIGQSNSANHAEKLIITKFPSKVLNYFDGKCYIAGSPLLGATGSEGEFLTMLADKLIENKTYDKVIIISSGIGGTPISRWQKDGDLNEMLLDTLTKLSQDFNVTDIIWHQGESDYINSTSSKVYISSFQSLQASLANIGIVAPYFISVSTKCGLSPKWTWDNPTATGQRLLADNKKIFIAANTDHLLGKQDRKSDACHFSYSGQEITANAYATEIANYKNAPDSQDKI